MSSQEFQQKLEDVAPLLQTANEKGKLLGRMEPHTARGTNDVKSRLDELSSKWDELQTKLSEKIAESEEKCEAVTALNNEVETVSRRLDELAASTEDLTAATYDAANVLEHRENYEVRLVIERCFHMTSRQPYWLRRPCWSGIKPVFSYVNASLCSNKCLFV